jgi:hypothetical protein
MPKPAPAKGERRATTYYGVAPFGDTRPEPPADAVWTVEEWDGSRWRAVGTARSNADRDRLLHQQPE